MGIKSGKEALLVAHAGHALCIACATRPWSIDALPVCPVAAWKPPFPTPQKRGHIHARSCSVLPGSSPSPTCSTYSQKKKKTKQKNRQVWIALAWSREMHPLGDAAEPAKSGRRETSSSSLAHLLVQQQNPAASHFRAEPAELEQAMLQVGT